MNRTGVHVVATEGKHFPKGSEVTVETKVLLLQTVLLFICTSRDFLLSVKKMRLHCGTPVACGAPENAQ